jgi:hypothetical protein
MKKSYEHLITAAGIAILVAIFCYQVCYGSNESDYKYGFKEGNGAYKQCNSAHTCTVEQNFYGPCSLYYPPPHWYKSAIGWIQIGPSQIHFVDNVTACNDGYFHGWIHECKNDGGGPICKYQDGGPVIAAITGPGTCDNTTGTCESGNFITVHKG